jgi:hypothetical protein
MEASIDASSFRSALKFLDVGGVRQICRTLVSKIALAKGHRVCEKAQPVAGLQAMAVTPERDQVEREFNLKLTNVLKENVGPKEVFADHREIRLHIMALCKAFESGLRGTV